MEKLGEGKMITGRCHPEAARSEKGSDVAVGNSKVKGQNYRSNIQNC
ncbi:MAG: hypothetical protein WC500_04190 [Candidatus Margulisiibacteriota bacterium]